MSTQPTPPANTPGLRRNDTNKNSPAPSPLRMSTLLPQAQATPSPAPDRRRVYPLNNHAYTQVQNQTQGIHFVNRTTFSHLIIRRKPATQNRVSRCGALFNREHNWHYKHEPRPFSQLDSSSFDDLSELLGKFLYFLPLCSRQSAPKINSSFRYIRYISMQLCNFHIIETLDTLDNTELQACSSYLKILFLLDIAEDVGNVEVERLLIRCVFRFHLAFHLFLLRISFSQNNNNFLVGVVTCFSITT